MAKKYTVWTSLIGTDMKNSKWYGKQVEMKVTERGYKQHKETGFLDGSEFRGYTDRIRKLK